MPRTHRAEQFSARTVHYWTGANVLPADPPRKRPGRDWWHVAVHWSLVHGALLPTGVEIQSVSSGAPVTARIFKRVPIGAVIEQGRGIASALLTGPGSHADETERVLATITDAPTGRPMVDERYRATARAYAAVLDDPAADRRRIAKLVAERIRADTEFNPSDALVRKWITRAGQLGYLRPIGHDHRTSN